MLDAIFFQPTTKCAKACKECYVINWAKNTIRYNELSSYEIEALVTLLIIKPLSRQLTIAIDDINIHSGVNSSLDEGLLAPFQALHYISIEDINTEIHITINSRKTLDNYIRRVGSLNHIMTKISYISISYITAGVDITTLKSFYPGTSINWNVQASEFLRLSKDKLIGDIIDSVESVHLLLTKAPLGEVQDRSNISQWLEALEVLRSLTIDQQDKFTLDRCMVESARFNKQRTTCSAGIRKRHIWPDGSVTGCPYNTRGLQPEKLTAPMGNEAALEFMREQAINNYNSWIGDCLKQYVTLDPDSLSKIRNIYLWLDLPSTLLGQEFVYCTIPDALKNYTYIPPDRNKNRYLRIIDS